MEAIILTADGAEDLELFYPYYRLQEEGITVDVAAPEKGEITTLGGKRLEANVSFWDMHADEYDLVVIPGGKAPETVRQDDRALELTRRVYEVGKPVAAVNHGPLVMISAEIMEGKRATCTPGIRDDLRKAGAQCVDEPVAVDDNLITCRGGSDLPAFCREMMRAVHELLEQEE